MIMILCIYAERDYIEPFKVGHTVDRIGIYSQEVIDQDCECGDSIRIKAFPTGGCDCEGNYTTTIVCGDESSNDSLDIVLDEYITCYLTSTCGTCEAVDTINITAANPCKCVWLFPFDNGSQPTSDCEVLICPSDPSERLWLRSFDCSGPCIVALPDGSTQTTNNNGAIIFTQPFQYGDYTFDCPIGCDLVFTVIEDTECGCDLEVEINGDLAICEGEPTTLGTTVTGGTPAFTYAWSNGGTGTSITVDNGGTYIVTVTDSEGCTATDEVVVTESTSPVVTCTGNNGMCALGSASVSATGGTMPYTYVWSNGGTTANIIDLDDGTYTVTVTDSAGCTSTCEVIINNTDPIDIACSGVNESCFGNDGFVSSSIGPNLGTPPYTYIWDDPNNSTTSSVSGLVAGTYCVTVTDVNGCTDDCCVTIAADPPLIAMLQDCDFCPNESCELISSASGGDGNYTFNPSPVIATISGFYSVTVTDGQGCTATATATATELPQPSVSTTVVHTSCNLSNGSATAIGSGGTPSYAYSWSSGGSGATVNNLAAGTYTVTVTDSNGCTATSTATINPSTGVDVNISGPTEACDFAFLTANPSGGATPYSYAWSGTPLTTTAAKFVNSSGTYTVTVTDANGCTNTASHTITIIDQPVVSSTNPPLELICASTLVLNGYFTGSTGGGSYYNSSCPSNACPSGAISNVYPITSSGLQTFAYCVDSPPCDPACDDFDVVVSNCLLTSTSFDGTDEDPCEPNEDVCFDFDLSNSCTLSAPFNYSGTTFTNSLGLTPVSIDLTPTLSGTISVCYNSNDLQNFQGSTLNITANLVLEYAGASGSCTASVVGNYTIPSCVNCDCNIVSFTENNCELTGTVSGTGCDNYNLLIVKFPNAGCTGGGSCTLASNFNVPASGATITTAVDAGSCGALHPNDTGYELVLLPIGGTGCTSDSQCLDVTGCDCNCALDVDFTRAWVGNGVIDFGGFNCNYSGSQDIGQCNGTVEYTASASGCNSPYTYEWYDGGALLASGNTWMPDNHPSGYCPTVDLVATDSNGCTGSTNIIVKMCDFSNVELGINQLVYNAVSGNIRFQLKCQCDGSPIFYEIFNPSGSLVLSDNWTACDDDTCDNVGSVTYIPLSGSGTYTVVASGDTDTVFVP